MPIEGSRQLRSCSRVWRMAVGTLTRTLRPVGLDELFAEIWREKGSGRLTSYLDWRRTRPRGSWTPRTLAWVAQQAGAGEDPDLLVRIWLDDLNAAWDDQVAEMLREEPPPAGDENWDSYLAALAEHVATRRGWPAPGWSAEPRRFLSQFWFPEGLSLLEALAIRESPASFRRRGIFIRAGALSRC